MEMQTKPKAEGVFIFMNSEYCFVSFRLADLSVEYELEKAPGLPELLSVIVNREDVEAIINKPVSGSCSVL